MREPAPDVSASEYQRPNQPWMCGLTEHGHACPAGPTATGHCPALAECAPVRDGDRWVCNSSALRGGSCGEGPTPNGGCGRIHQCRPVRSLRAKRGRFIATCAVFALGCTFIGLSADWRDRVIKPGPLAQQHAQLLEGSAGQPNCRACHAAASQKVAGWATSLVSAHDDQPSQSQLCMNCHAKTISTEHALLAHNLPTWMLELASGSRGRGSLHTDKEVACAICHREHHGAQADLTAMDDVACQACHQRRYKSFAEDHPGFGVWPYVRRTRIVFDHASHRAKHFADKKQTFDCRVCHISDSSGQVQRLASYETACAACHDEKIAMSVGSGVPIFALPTLDVVALKKAGHDVGPWPKGATGDFDGRLSPQMKLLLAGDRKAQDAMVALGANFDFQDIDPNDVVQLAACAELAKAIKAMLGDIGRRGPVSVRERLSNALAPILREPDADALMAGLSVDTFRGVTAWLPGIGIGSDPWPRLSTPPLIKGRLGARGSDNPERYLPTYVEIPPREALRYDAAGQWTRDDQAFSIRYRPAGHADPVLASWLQLLATTPGLKHSGPLPIAIFKELTKPTAPGLCTTCHSIDQRRADELTISWRAYDRTTEPRGFTKFSHGPHLVLPQLENCATCHAIDDTARTAASFAELNPQHFVSEFKPMEKRYCAECHIKSAAGDSCQSCHNYHVEGSGLRVQGSAFESDLNSQR